MFTKKKNVTRIIHYNKMPTLDFCIVIPVYNEEKIILNTINKALKFLKEYNFKIVIVNDGSNDSSKKILSKVKNKKVLTLNKKNEGHGKALITGYKKALNLNAKFVLQADSDDQISFTEFKKLFKYKNKFDCIVGKRKNRKDPLSRILISFVLKVFIFLLFGKYIDDSNCPLRVIRTNFLREIIDHISFAQIPNILISIAANKKKIYKSVDIIHRQRYSGSSIKYFKLLKLCIISYFDILKFKFFK